MVANGPAWHDRFPAKEINAPIRCGVSVEHVRQDGAQYLVETWHGTYRAGNVVAATGPFQRPVMPQLVPETTGITQMHSTAYRNPDQLTTGADLVVGAGSSGTQIAQELMQAGRQVYLSVGSHDRPPRSYRGKDFVWWLGALGKWRATTPGPGVEHVTIAVCGVNGGETVDFRRLAGQGMTLLGRIESCTEGVLQFAPDLASNMARGDANYISVPTEADAYIAEHALNFQAEPEAHLINPDPDCVGTPISSLNLTDAGITTIIWAVWSDAEYLADQMLARSATAVAQSVECARIT